MAENDITTGMYIIVAYGASNSSSQGSRADNAKVLCRRGGSNSAANDMVIYTQSARPMPIIASVYRNTDDNITIYAPLLNGKAACVKQSDMYQPSEGDPYPRDGAVVYSESYAGGRRAQWTAEQVQNLVGYYDGDTYPVYRLINAMSPDAHKMVMHTPSYSNGATVVFRAYADGSGSVSQYWMFIPQSRVPSGFYNIRLATAPNRLLEGKSNGQIVLSTDSETTDTNGRVWYLKDDENVPDHQFIRNLGRYLADNNGGYLLVSQGQNVNKGRPNIGRLTDGGHYDRWVFTPHGESDTYNDDKYQSYEMVSSGFNYDYWAASRYVLGGYQNGGSNLLTYPNFQFIGPDFSADLRHMQWFLTWAHAYNKDLTVPSKLGLDYDGVPNYSTFGIAGSNEYVYPSWVGGDNENWQLRYRFKTYRRASDGVGTNRTYSDSSWKSIMDNDSANNGWGDNEVPNCSATLSYNESGSTGALGRYISDLGIPVTLGNSGSDIDRLFVEFEVRAWESQFDKISEELSCHGGAASKTISIAYKPTLTLSQLKVDAYGMYLTYTSDFHRNGNKVIIESQGNAIQLPWQAFMTSYKSGSVMRTRMENQKLCENGLAKYTGKYYLNFGASGIPNLGDEIPFVWTITSPDGVANTGSTVLAVSATDFSNVVTVDCPTSYTDNGSRILKVDVVTGNTLYFEEESTRCTLVINHRPNGTEDPSQFVRNASNLPYLEYIDIPRTRTAAANGDEYFAIPYPFGKPFKVEILGGTDDAQGRIGRFEYYHEAFKQFRDRTRMWNFGDVLKVNSWYEIFVNESENPTESVSTQFTSNAVKTTERDWEIVQFGNTPEQTRSVGGVVYPDLMDDYIPRTDAFSKCKYAWYRSFDGEVLRTAITSVKETRKTWGTSISVEMRRIDV